MLLACWVDVLVGDLFMFRFRKSSNAEGMSSLIFLLQEKELRLSVQFSFLLLHTIYRKKKKKKKHDLQQYRTNKYK